MRARRARRLQIAFRVTLTIDEIELQLYRYHGGKPALTQTLPHSVQHIARFNVKGSAIFIQHGEQHLRDILRVRRRRRQRARYRHAHVIRLAQLLPQPGLFHHVAENIHRKYRRREVTALLQFVQAADRDAFAAEAAVQVGQQYVDMLG